MDKSKILLVCSNSIATEIQSLLSLFIKRFSICSICASGNEAVRKASQMAPDVVITDYNLPDINGFEVAVKLEDLKVCPTIILASTAQCDYIDELKKDSINIFCIAKPVDKHILLHVLELAIRMSHKFTEIQNKVTNLEHQIEERKNVDRARGILMKKFNLDEQQAYRNLQKKAMDSGRTINDIAKTIIKMFDFIDKKNG